MLVVRRQPITKAHQTVFVQTKKVSYGTAKIKLLNNSNFVQK